MDYHLEASLGLTRHSYQDAVRHFDQALELVGDNMNQFWEPTLYNLANCYRRLRYPVFEV